MWDYIDLYCERTAPGLLNEPVNAFTNLAFALAAIFLLRYAHTKKKLNWRIIVLSLLMLVIAAGSASFHTMATHGAMLADSIPILLFQIAFLFFYARGVMALAWPYTAILFCAFALCIYGFGLAPAHWLNGSLSYAPAFIFLLGLGLWHLRNAAREPYILLIAAGVFVLSLSMRTLDMLWCDLWPWGLHFLWHILNGFVLYLSGRAVVTGERKA